MSSFPGPNGRKRLDGSSLSAHLRHIRKNDLKKARNPDSFKKIPISLFQDLNVLGRARYVAIVVATIMSSLWDGWTSRITTRRTPKKEVMITRRMLHDDFGLGESAAGKALQNLVRLKKSKVAKKHVYSGKQGQNLGTLYRLDWMENPKGKTISIYWGLLVSEPFLALSVTLQAVLILLHQFHSRRTNRLTIKPYALEAFGIHRNRLTEYTNDLRNTGLINYIENDDYEFAWFNRESRPAFYKLNLIHLSNTDLAPKSYQVAANE